MIKLTEEELKQFNENGAFIYRGLLTPEEVEELSNAMSEIDSKQNNTHAAVFHPHEQNATFKKIMTLPKITELAAQVVNSKKVQGLQSAMYYKAPGSLGRDAHQENFYHRTLDGASVTVWMSVDKADKNNGGMWGYAGSHKEGILEIVEDKNRVNLTTDSNGFQKDRGLVCVIPDKYKDSFVWLDTNPGDVIFVHNNVIHGSYKNESTDRFRRAFICVYIREGCEFYQGEYAKRRPIDVQAAAMGGI